MTMPQPTGNNSSYMENLNAPQREAVEALDGAVLVLAGAGTGKTRVLTTRLAHLIATGKAWPSQILAVTFTNKAAQEMKERVAHTLGQPVEGWWLGTFHSLSARMLRRHAELVGLTSNFTIIDPDDQQRVIKQLLEAENIDTKKCPPSLVQSVIDRWKDKAWTPEAITADEAGNLANGKMRQIYAQYQARLKQLNACDFGDLMLHMITILKNPQHADILQLYHKQFRYILVDEYQDTNVAQYLWLRILAQGSGNICCVGDDDQSIYGWRGAEVDNILRFEKDFPDAKIIRLEQNYRSTGHILNAASSVIANNDGRLGKTLWSDANIGEKIKVCGFWSDREEAQYIINEIKAAESQTIPLSEIAILVRTIAQTYSLDKALATSGIPYRIIGGTKLLERQEGRDILSYMRLLAQSADDLALERIINVPKRGIGAVTLNDLRIIARERGISLYSAIEQQLKNGGLKPKIRAPLQDLFSGFARWKDSLQTMPHPIVASMVLEESGYLAMIQAQKDSEAHDYLGRLNELLRYMEDFETLEAFLEHAALVTDNKDRVNTEQVTLMTMHAAKGLEFRVLFLPGWEEGIFPSPRSINKDLEEERRLAYVAITRAREQACISYVTSRYMHGETKHSVPSRFIGELPPDSIESNSEIVTHASTENIPYFQRQTAANRKYLDHLVEEASDYLPSQPSGGMMKGTRVRHRDFGEGTIVHIDGKKLDIAFDDGEMRRLMAGFVERL
ncbi:MAG: AAA family ATPase [Alphaproteobacteria bacterium]|nr:AAA family ATPase [Alphaproteobacteria bacterium]